MTRDLEETLKELGPGYREVVDRLVAAYEPAKVDLAAQAAREEAAKRASRRGRAVGWTVAYLVAASLLVFLGLGVVFRPSPRRAAPAPRVYTVRATTAENEYRLAMIRDDKALQEIIRTQNPDGSWKNDFLTKQNAAALMACQSEEAQVAFKKAMRNLRQRGIQ